MTASADVLIAGAGIVGTACAWELAKAGLRVAVVEQSFPAAGATGSAMGHVVVMDDSEPQFALTRFSQSLWDDLRDQLPPAVHFDRCGTLWLALDDQELAEVRRKFTRYQARGVRAEILDSRALHQAEPNLKSPLAGALFIPGDSVVYPPAAAAFFLEQATNLGASIHLGKAIATFANGTARLTDGTVLHAAKLINAAGQHAAQLTPGLQVKPRKGHLASVDRHPGFVRHQVVELGYLQSAHSLTADSVAFNVQPRNTGQLLIGSSRQFDVAHDRVDPAIVSQMLQRASIFLPSLGPLSEARVWTGFRPATPDKLPFIGPWREDPTLYVAAGHEGLGVTTSLATAKLICAHITGAAPPIPAEPYLPSRQKIA